jgi:hypothetical protein
VSAFITCIGRQNHYLIGILPWYWPAIELGLALGYIEIVLSYSIGVYCVGEYYRPGFEPVAGSLGRQLLSAGLGSKAETVIIIHWLAIAVLNGGCFYYSSVGGIRHKIIVHQE